MGRIFTPSDTKPTHCHPQRRAILPQAKASDLDPSKGNIPSPNTRRDGVLTLNSWPKASAWNAASSSPSACMSVSGTYLPPNLPNLPMAGRTSPAAVGALHRLRRWHRGHDGAPPQRHRHVGWARRGGARGRRPGHGRGSHQRMGVEERHRCMGRARRGNGTGRGVGGLATEKVAIEEWELNGDGVVFSKKMFDKPSSKVYCTARDLVSEFIF
jgi:hypothetical protein